MIFYQFLFRRMSFYPEFEEIYLDPAFVEKTIKGFRGGKSQYAGEYNDPDWYYHQFPKEDPCHYIADTYYGLFTIFLGMHIAKSCFGSKYLLWYTCFRFNLQKEKNELDSTYNTIELSTQDISVSSFDSSFKRKKLTIQDWHLKVRIYMEEYFRVCFMFFVAYLIQMMLVFLSLGDKLSNFIIKFWLIHAIVVYPVNCWCIYRLLKAIELEKRRVTSLIEDTSSNIYKQPLRIKMLDPNTMTLVNYKNKRQQSFTALNIIRRVSKQIKPKRGSVTTRDLKNHDVYAVDSSVNTMKMVGDS